MKQKLIKSTLVTLCLLAALFVQPVAAGAQTGQRPDGARPVKDVSELMKEAKALSKLRSVSEYGYEFIGNTVDYVQFWENSYMWKTIQVLAPANAQKVYIRFKIKNFVASNPVRLAVSIEGNEKQISIDYQGIAWIDSSDCRQYGDEQNTYQYADLMVYPLSPQTIEYELDAFTSKDAPGALASMSGKFIILETLPQITATKRIAGDLNTDIPLKIEVTPGSLGNIPAKLAVKVSGINPNAFTLSGTGFVKDESDLWNSPWICTIPSLGQASQYVLQMRATESCTGSFDIQLLDENSNPINTIYGNKIVIPSSYDESEIEGLKALAAANPSSADLRDFIAKELWKEDREFYGSNNYNVGVSWDTQSPSHIETLFIRNQREALTQVDLTPFTQLKELDLSYNSLKKLDVSMLSTLTELRINGTPLLYKDVTFPEVLSEYFHCNGYSTIMVGTPIDAYTSSAPSGTEIDLSSQAEVNGEKTTYTWYKSDKNGSERVEVKMPLADNKPGVFILEGEPGKYYSCEMSSQSPAYRNWTIETVDIKLLRTNVAYSEADVAAIKKIATDNPDNKKLKEYIETEGWKIENWDSRQDIIRTNWKFDSTPVRLTHLCIEPMRGQDNKIDSLLKLDVSAFTELRHLECMRYNGITELYLSKNTKLEVLRIYSETLKSLNVSKCPNLTELTFNREGSEYFESSRNILTDLNFSGCSKLTTFKITGSPITRLDFSGAPLLESLFINNCKQLADIGGFYQLTKLQTLALKYTGENLKVYAKKFPDSVIRLYCNGTDYPVPTDAAILNRLVEYGIPANVETFDMQTMPKLTFLEMWKSKMSYSKMKNPKHVNKGMNYQGETTLLIPDRDGDGRFQNGDTIDLSSEVMIAGSPTTFIWVNQKYNTEEKEAIKAVPNKPGVFTIDSKEEKYGRYQCIMGNPLFTRSDITINSWSGWRLVTSSIYVQTAIEETFYERDVNTLATIVRNSTDASLQEWFGSGSWKKNGTTPDYKISIEWNNSNPKRLTSLHFSNMGDGLAKVLDISDLDSLSRFVCRSNNVTEIILPTNTTKLNSLTLVGLPLLKSLNVSPYSNLSALDISNNTYIGDIDLSKNKKLVYLYCNNTSIMPAAIHLSDYPELKEYGVPANTDTLDLTSSKLNRLSTWGSRLKFSNILNPYQIKDTTNVVTQFAIGNIRGIASSYGRIIDFMPEMKVSETASDITWKVFSYGQEPRTLESKEGACNITEDVFNPGDTLQTVITNSLFPGWSLSYSTIVYSCPGDANLDKDVNVQDVTATVSYVINDKPNMIHPFGWLEADVNEDDFMNVADVVGIVNLIEARPVLKSNALREDYTPVVKLSTDEKGYLYMDAPVAVAGVQFAFAGTKGTLTLVGKAAQMAQASAMSGDTLRILAYGANGQTIPAGKTMLMQLPKGAQLLSADFSDADARSLKSDRGGVATSIETIHVPSSVTTISNYPNPFQGTTTFAYTLAENAKQASIQIFSANGSLVQTLNGLPAYVGPNTYTCTIQLSAGVYYYRLLLKGQGELRISKSNQFIIK